MNSNVLLIRSLSGPLTLILVGVLFVIDHGGAISFSKTWPIIIIFLGVTKLAERALAGEQPPPPPYSQGGAQ